MRIVSYNIRLALDSSLDRVGEILCQLRADVACLQEVGSHWTMGEPVDMWSVLAHKTGLEFGLFAPAILQGQARYGIALLSRFPVEVVQQTFLPRRDDEPRVLLVCRIEDEPGSWLLATTHLSVVPGDRPAQIAKAVEVLRSALDGPEERLVLAGDFNTALDDPDMLGLMHRLDLRSTIEQVHRRPIPTYPVKAPRLPLDHILVGAQVRIIDAGVAEITGSDHFPAWAELQR
ncbi:MAG: endonuclease/exonuclease/phosphatase family protein [Bradymonadales bacterium]|nr:endonuclease/exonuclease/phosphatase family protein [Bradymonadales bacterium]